MELLELTLSAVNARRFLAISSRVPKGVGDASTECDLPFWVGNQDWRTTIIKVLESSQGFRSENFPEEGEQDWLEQEGLLLPGRQHFDSGYLKRIGFALYQSLFPADSNLKQVLQHSLRLCEDRSSDLHLRLKFAADSGQRSRLADYPWELLHDGQRFLLHQRVRLSRYIAYESPPPKLLAQEMLRVLLISARPQGLPQLTQEEQQAIQEGLKRAQDAGFVQLQILPSPTRKALNRYLTDCSSQEMPQVLHFDGHGVFGKRCTNPSCLTMHPGIKAESCRTCGQLLPEAQGYLAFESEQGKPDWQSATQVAAILQPYLITLVVLSACQSGMAVAGDSVFNGMAQNLIDQRVPAVVAMQYSVRADAARDFAEQFYWVLGKKEPLLKALNQGIREMDVDGNQWYRPVLFLRWQDNEGGNLFVDASVQSSPVIPVSDFEAQNDFSDSKPSHSSNVEPLISTSLKVPAMLPANSIFISYRRSDSNDVTGRIFDRLSEHFGREVVFKDVDSIPLGVDFRTHLNQGVGNCQVLVAVVGPTWLNVQDAEGNRRLDNPDDWVRAEIETALGRDIPVIPLLVGGARLPRAEELPGTLEGLAYRNAAQARPDPDFHLDLNRLIRRLEEIVGLPELVSVEQSSLSELTVEQRKELRVALISAFPRQPDLELMIEDELGESFNLITQGQPNYELAVRDLVKWAEAQGKVRSLLEGAVRSNPGNPKLQELAKLWLKK